MDRHVASLLAMTIRKGFIASNTERLGARSRSRDDNAGKFIASITERLGAFVRALAVARGFNVTFMHRCGERQIVSQMMPFVNRSNAARGLIAKKGL